jgi:hypothetical protein
MARRSTAEPVTPAYTPQWVAVEEWKDLVAGDTIKVSGERGDFRFISAHVIDGEAISIIAHGGVYGHTTMRAFYPNRVTKVRAKRRKADEEAA